MLNVFRFVAGAIYGGVSAHSTLIDGAIRRVFGERGIEAVDCVIERYAPEWLYGAVNWLVAARGDYSASVDNGVDAARAFICRLRRG